MRLQRCKGVGVEHQISYTFIITNYTITIDYSIILKNVQ
jgi:hypothetical protein